MLSINFTVQVQNAVDYLKIIGALDENENLTVLGKRTCTFLHLRLNSPAIFFYQLMPHCYCFPKPFLGISLIYFKSHC
jgi:dihydroorotase